MTEKNKVVLESERKSGQIKKILIELETGKKYFVKDLNEDFYTSTGTISKKDLISNISKIKSNKNKSFLALNPLFPDLWESLQRGPQVMLPKDIGWILAKTGVNGNFKTVDGGGGSGSLCLSLANVAKEVTAYEINPENVDIIEKNKKLFGITNLIVKQADIYKGIEETDLNLLTLDLAEPWRVVKFAESSLSVGGFLVVYLPNLTQVKQFIDACFKTSINVVETIELIERKWKIEDKIMRPEFQMLGHTGFMTICRKI